MAFFHQKMFFLPSTDYHTKCSLFLFIILFPSIYYPSNIETRATIQVLVK